jgi:hypothetical protein
MKKLTLLITCAAFVFVSCNKKEEKKDLSIFGVYHGKTHLYGVNTPVPYDTTIDETFTISDNGDGRISIYSISGRLGMYYGILRFPNAEHRYTGDDCYGRDSYQIFPEQQLLSVHTEFTAGMGGYIYCDFSSSRTDK